MRRTLRLFMTGLAMGTADLIPGVSGGTIAFLAGIYQELLHALKQVTGTVPRLALRGSWAAAGQAIPWRFAGPLAAGILTAVFTLARLLSWLLHEHPSFVWAFFFGLVLASTGVVLRRVGRWTIGYGIMFAAAAAAAYILVGLVPVETPNTLLFIFVSGMIAICAMILPGISGSFILLLLGKYQQVLGAVVDRDVVLLLVFTAGCVAGLALFSRLLSWLFVRYHDVAVAGLAGLMLGSIRKIWPWKQVVETRIDHDGAMVPLIEHNILPDQFDGAVAVALLLCGLGVWLVLYLDRRQLVHESEVSESTI